MNESFGELTDSERMQIMQIRQRFEQYGVLESHKIQQEMTQSKDFQELLDSAIESSQDEHALNPEYADPELDKKLYGKINNKNLMLYAEDDGLEY